MDASVLVTKHFSVLLLFFCYFDVFAVCSTCNVDEVAVRNLASGTTECHHCPNCPIGYGLAVLCGSTITSVTSLKCVPCKKGINYSDTHDYSMCQSCRHCHPHQEITGQCTPEKDKTICGKCQNGYYKEITGGKCEECTWCCKDNENQRRMPECIQAGLVENKQCAKFALSESCKPKEPNSVEQGLPYETKIAIGLGVPFGLLFLLVIVLVGYPKTRQKLKSFICWKQQSNGNTERTNKTSVQLQGRHKYSFQKSWPSTTRVINDDFNPDHLSGDSAKNESKANTSGSAFPSLNRIGNMVKRSTPHLFDRGCSYPGYPVKSNNLFGPTFQQIFKKSSKWVRKNQNNFKKFDNEGDDANLSSNYHGESTYGAPIQGDCHRTVSSGHGSFKRVGCPEDLKVDSRNKQICLSTGDGHVSDKRPFVVVMDGRVNQSVPPAAFSDAIPKCTYTTEHAEKVEKVLQGLKADPQFSNSRLCERASEISYSVLEELCPIMNCIRDPYFDDFRMMGEYMGLSKSIINSAGQRPNPTETLLSRFGGTVGHLMAILVIIKRDDAFSVLERYCLKPDNSLML